jgi:hypothetical protein
MRSETARRGGHRLQTHRLGGAIGVLAAVALALTAATPASALPSTEKTEATATVAPISASESYVVTLTNTGNEGIRLLLIGVGEEPPATNIVSNAPTCEFGKILSGTIACKAVVKPGESEYVCYTGHVPGTVLPDGSSDPINVYIESEAMNENTKGVNVAALSPSVASCPLPGFNPNPPVVTPIVVNTPITGSTPLTGNTPAPSVPPVKPLPSSAPKPSHAFTRAQCKSAYKAWTKKHKHATPKQKKAEANTLHKAHGCPLSSLK